MISIKLKVSTGKKDADGNDIRIEKTFFTTPSGRAVRDAAELQHKMAETSLTVEFIDEMATYAVNLFKGQFTTDDLYDGLDAGSLGKACLDLSDDVLKMFYQKVDELPNAETGRQ